MVVVSLPQVETDGALFDLLCREFGVGDFDEETSEIPHWKWRATNVAKVKRVREARKVALADLVLAIEYCKAHGIDIRDATWLYKQIMPAIRWDRERTAATVEPESFEARYEAAIQRAFDTGDTQGAGVLLRAAGQSAREQALASWLERE